MHKEPKSILHLLLMVILGCIAGVAVFFFIHPFFMKDPKPKQKVNPYTVITPSVFTRITPAKDVNTSKWNTYTDKKSQFSLRYPTEIIIDERQTSEGRITVFIFEEDKEATLPGKVTGLYISDTHDKSTDGFSSFRENDCGAKCDLSYKKADWVNVNNVYGIRNPLPEDIANYYVTDKDQKGNVINLYVGGYLSKEESVKKKITTFEEIVKTIEFSR